MNDLKNLKVALNSMIPGEPVPDDVWETQDGRRIYIAQMTDKHLVNTLLYLKRKVTARITRLGLTKSDWQTRERFYRFLPKKYRGKFINMEAEALKRGLSDWESRHPIRER